MVLNSGVMEILYAVKLEFKTINNLAEYEAFITELRLSLTLKAEEVKVRVDSQLVTNHHNDNFQTKWEKMKAYLHKAK